jgi:DNA-binding NtrC family response regulator
MQVPHYLLRGGFMPIRSSLTRLLQREGYDTVLAENADDAFSILEKKTVSVVLSDFTMPGQSGVEFLKEVKKRFPKPIRIILSGKADMKQVMEAVNSGVISHFLTKPWNNEILKDMVQHYTQVLEKDWRSAEAPKGEIINEDLEKTYPGITQLKVTEEGAIIIDE